MSGTTADWIIVGILLVMVVQGALMQMNENVENFLLKKILEAQQTGNVLLQKILNETEAILAFLKLWSEPKKMLITQLGGECMAITGVPVGGTGTFQETPLPAGSAFPSGTVITWSADDPLVTLTASADGTQVVAAVPSNDGRNSFTLTASAAMPQVSTPIMGSALVPILPAVLPTPTSMQIDQIA